MGRIADKVAVITGGASGIGAAAAEKLLGEGAYVVLGDIQAGCSTQVEPCWTPCTIEACGHPPQPRARSLR